MRICQRQRRHLCESLREWLSVPPFTCAFLKSPRISPPDFMQNGWLSTNLWRHIDFTIWRPYRRKSNSRFWFGHVSHIRRSKAIGIPNLDQIFQSTAEILLLPVAENTRPPYWNFTSGFNFDVFAVIGMWFCIGPTNCIPNGRPPTELWRYIDFTRWRPYRRKSTSRFWFDHVSHLRRSRAICIPNFDQISQSMAEILLLSVSKNKRRQYWNSTSGFNFDVFAVIGMWFCIGLTNFMQTGWSPTELWCHIGFTRWRP